MGHGLNWENLPSFIKGTQLHLSCYKLLYQMGRGYPLKKVEHKIVIQFIKEQIIYKFGIPQSITTDQGTMFTGDKMTYFAKEYGIQLIRSSLFYAQENGQAEAYNKVLINILEKMLVDNPRYWHLILYETLWAYRTS